MLGLQLFQAASLANYVVICDVLHLTSESITRLVDFTGERINGIEISQHYD